MAYYKNQELLEGAHKPKSPDPETITYLCQIEGLLDSHAAKMNKNQQASNGQQKNDSDENMEEDDSDDEEQLDLLVNNVHEEISGQQAGLSIDKSASVILEKLLTLSTPAQLRQFGASLRGYFLFLSSHRFGSHVLQKFMTLAPTVVSWDQHVLSASQKKTEEGEKKEGTDGPPITMEAILIDLCDEVGDKWIQLGKDLCGTHVMRSLLHSLTGRISVANNKTGSYTGKKKKKKKSGSKGKGRKKKGVAEYDEKYFNNSSNAIPEKTHEIPSSWSETLSNIIQSVSAKPAKDLYDMTFDTNASPILQLLMTLGSDKEDETDSLIRRILDWDELVAYEQRCAEKKQQSHIDGTELEQFRSWVDDMIRDTCSSHVLEVILQSSSDELFADLLDRIFSAHIAKYAKLPICNYVIQQLITCVRSSEQLERVMNELKHSMDDLITPRLLGVVWRMVEATNVHKSGQERMVRWLVRASKKKIHKDVVTSILWAPPKMATEEGDAIATSTSTEIPIWKHKQSGGNTSESTSSSTTSTDVSNGLCLNIAGARTIQQLFLGSPSHNTAILSSFARQTTEQLVHLGLHPVGSRGVLEVLLTGPEDYDRAKQHLVDRLTGQWTKLSSDRFGTYVVQKCYEVARQQRRESMVSELAKNVRTLSGSAHGRHVLRTCRVELYARSPEQWRAAIRGADRRRQMFESEFSANTEKKSDNKRKTDGGIGGEHPSKKKRKRKRKKKKETVVEE